MTAPQESEGPPLCTTCGHHEDIGWMIPVHGCGQEVRHDPVDGKRLYRRCAYARSEKGACGPEGKLWKARPSSAQGDDNS